MAVAKRKKPAPKKRASKKSPSKKKTASQKGKLNKMAHTDFELVWNSKRTECVFACDETGTSCESSCGVTDCVSGYRAKDGIALLSINYLKGYAAIEIFSEDGLLFEACADAEEASALCGKSKLEDCDASELAEAFWSVYEKME